MWGLLHVMSAACMEAVTLGSCMRGGGGGGGRLLHEVACTCRGCCM